jgi:hypothetical protein
MTQRKEEALCMRCREKGSVSYEQYDAYGIYAGTMCDACFKKDYRQDRYFDPDYAGERLEEEEY